jgi:hypothetical protein
VENQQERDRQHGDKVRGEAENADREVPQRARRLADTAGQAAQLRLDLLADVVAIVVAADRGVVA